jgi:hypothetical protein
MTSKKPLIIGLMLGAVLICAGILVLATTNARGIGNLYNDLVLGNRDHFLSCAELPTEADVRRTMQAHQDEIGRIEQIHPGSIEVAIDAETCPGRADIVINFATRADRSMIESVIGGDTFFGIPFRLRNR